MNNNNNNINHKRKTNNEYNVSNKKTMTIQATHTQKIDYISQVNSSVYKRVIQRYLNELPECTINDIITDLLKTEIWREPYGYMIIHLSGFLSLKEFIYALRLNKYW